MNKNDQHDAYNWYECNGLRSSSSNSNNRRDQQQQQQQSQDDDLPTPHFQCTMERNKLESPSLDSSSGSPSANNDSSMDEQQLQRTQDVCSAYLRGQLANVAKAAVWWSTFGVVAEALTLVPLAVGTTRLVFNLALVFLSPLAGIMVEVSVRVRMLSLFVWVRCAPCARLRMPK